MADKQRLAPIDRLPPDCRAMVDSTIKLLMLYFPDRDQIEMQVGRATKATVKFEGGPITQEVIADTMAHLAFYKKYYPKDAAQNATTMELDSPEKILDALVAAWEVHRGMIDAKALERLAASSDQEPEPPKPETPTPPAQTPKSARHYQSNFEPT